MSHLYNNSHSKRVALFLNGAKSKYIFVLE